MPLVDTPKVEPDLTVLLDNVRWSTYLALLEDLQEARGRKLFFDRGILEIAVPSPAHEKIKQLIGRFIEAMTLELAIDISGFGIATWKREDLQRGFESDECYYVQNEILVRGRDEIDLTQDPPPDLVVEVDLGRSGMDKQSLFAAFGIAEAWRYNGDNVRFYALRHGRSPAGLEIERSLAFPFLAPGDIDRFLALRSTLSETRVVEAFREWVRTKSQGIDPI